MRYSESNIECSYIQNLLYNYYLPTIRVLQNKDDAIEGEQYIYNGAVFGGFKGDDGEDLENKIIKDYTPGKRYLGITQNHISESNNYNSDLHEALGNYLRFIRDYYHMDLMPLYNCFSNRFIDTFSLPITQDRIKGSVIKEGTKLFAFPARFGSTYSILCKGNCDAKVQIAFFNKKRPLGILSSINNEKQEFIIFPEDPLSLSQYQENLYSVKDMDEYIDILGSQWDDNKKLTVKKRLLHNQINLYLFVQIPEENADSIIVIENNSTKVVNNSLINNLEQVPFSDKLMGYLLNYYITPLSNIQQNIERIQDRLSKYKYKIEDPDSDQIKYISLEGDYIKGTFDYITRNFIYNLFRFRGIEDFTGYVDKDVERLIMTEGEKK